MQDLLAELQNHKSISMLRTTARHVSACLDVPVEQLSIDALVGVASRLTAYLRARRYKRNAIRSYRNYAGMLLREAKLLGWMPREPKAQVSEAWRTITSVAKAQRCAGIVRHAIAQGIMPSDFSDIDLTAWGQMMLSEQRSFDYVRECKALFRRVLTQSGLAQKLPGISHRKLFKYCIPLRNFPEQLRDELIALLDWKQAPYSEGRSRDWKIRDSTAKGLTATFERLYGFITKRNEINGQPTSIRSLAELVTKESVGAFIKYLLNERKVQGETVSMKLGSVCAALEQRYKDRDFAWFRELLSGIEPSAESERWARKEATSLRYEVLVNVAEKLHKKRTETAQTDRRQIAHLVHDELLVRWLLIMVWRQKNIRKCRLGSSPTRSNLFKDKISPSAKINVPRWARERMKLNPDERFWQYCFREQETKTGHAVHSVLPRRLVPLLEEYLQHHRPILLVGADPGTLFLNREGRPLNEHTINSLVGKLTLRHAQKRVTPHRFRDAFAYWWLEQFPQDYLTVSKKLWHRSVQFTLNVYGCRFDESQADCRIEECAESCEQSPECHLGPAADDGEIIEAIRNLITKDNAFQELPPAAKQNELSAIASIIKSHPWLARIVAADLRKNAVGTVQVFGSGGIRGKSAG
jgi:integrase